MSGDDLTKDELLSRFLQMEDRIDEVEEKLDQKDERIEELETRLRKYENPHTPPSKRRSGTDESPTSQDDEDDDLRTDGGTPGRKDGHDPEWRSPPDPDEEVDVTCDCCPECGQHFDESVGVSPRLVEEIPDPQPPEVTQYNHHRYQCDSCGTETVATHPDCPDEGQFGVNVIAQSALSRYDHRLPYRKIADRFEQLHELGWEKQRRRVAKAKRSIRRKVLDFQHKLTTWLVKEYDLVAVEDLNVKPMLETHQSAKSKQDAAWSRFLRLLEYKGDLYGTHVIRVNPAGTSKECSQCGVETPKPVWVREHSCPACGHEEDRDLNAAKNILSRGKAKVGVGCSESTPVETALPTSTSLEVDAKRVIEAGSPEA